MAFNTGNPVPSTDGRDLSDNAEIIDGFANSTAASINDRLGVPRRTLSKINSQVLELEAQYVFTAINNGVWAAGQTFTALNQYMVFSGTAYKPKNSTSLPYVVGATPVGDNNVEVVANLSTAQGDARYGRKYNTLADWQNDPSALLGDEVTTVERSTGNGGGATGDVIASGTETGFRIVKHNTLPLSWQLRNKKGFIDVDQYGAKRNDPSFDNSPVEFAAAVDAMLLSNQINLGNNDLNPRPFVRYTPGVVYYHLTETALNFEAVRIDFRCDGVCVIAGATESTPAARTALGYSFNRVYRTIFKGFIFAGFDKIHEWDTDNADQATVLYDECDFFDSGDPGVPVIDTRSFAESRSTDLVFRNCRTSFVPMLLDCFCDTLRFEGGIHRNFDPDGALIQADSLVTTVGGMFVPQVPGDDARFFDLYDNGVTGTRGFNSNGTRFSPEGGGIPVIYNFMEGEDAATNHLTNFIVFEGGANSASSGTLEGGLVVLTDNGVNSRAPSMIGFYGASVRSNSGLVRTKNGFPVGKNRGRFAIDVSMASQSHLTDITVPVSTPLVEDILRPYLVGQELYNEATVLTIGGVTTTIDLVAVNAGPQPILQISGASATIDGIDNAFDGQIVTLEFLNSAGVVEDFSNGSRIFLNGSVNFTTGAFGTLTLRWNRAGDKWFEIGRSSR